MAAPPGNQNASKGRMFEQALKRAIAQDDGKRLRDAAEMVLNKAAAGEPWAIGVLADRLDGKPSQAIVGSGENGEHLFQRIERVVVDPQ